MERFGARNSPSLEHCLSALGGCNLAIFVLGHCYGSIDVASGKSYTELEYDHAVANNIDRLVFIYEGPLKIEHIEQAEKRLKLDEFSSKVRRDRQVHRYSDVVELGRQIAIAISNYVRGGPVALVGENITLLRFPFATSVLALNTVLTISNCGASPMETTSGIGNVRLLFYGSFSAPDEYVREIGGGIALFPGSTQTYSLRFGGSLGWEPVEGFQGYVYAICNFPHARGIAYISSTPEINSPIAVYVAEVVIPTPPAIVR